MATYTWKQNASGNTDDPNNWDQGAVPGPGDTAIINSGSATIGPGTVLGQNVTFTTAVSSDNSSYTDHLTFQSVTLDAGTTFTFNGPITNSSVPYNVVDAPGTLTNQGRIVVGNGSAETAITLESQNSGDTIENAGTITVNALSGVTIDTLAGNSHTFQNDGTVTVGAGGRFDVLGYSLATLDDANSSFVNNGLFYVSGANAVSNITAALSGSGLLVADNSATIFIKGPATNVNVVARNGAGVAYSDQYQAANTPEQNQVYGGSFTFGANALLDIQPDQSVSSTSQPDFERPLFNVPLYGFAAGDSIRLDEQLGYAITSDSYDPATGVYDLLGTGGGVVAGFKFVGAYTEADFKTTNANGIYTITTASTANAGEVGPGGGGPACYCAGTLILTDRGEVPVEDLAAGDRVVTASGAVEPVVWLGRRSYGGRFLRGRRDMLPVCIRAGALGEHVPRRDLWVSPLHAMFIDGVLVPARLLVNGVSVVQPGVQPGGADSVHYVHVELERHDVLLAEGAPSESFVDDDSRGMFQNAHEFAALHPDRTPVPALLCAPRVEDGEVLRAIKRAVDARAGLAVAA